MSAHQQSTIETLKDNISVRFMFCLSILGMRFPLGHTQARCEIYV